MQTSVEFACGMTFVLAVDQVLLTAVLVTMGLCAAVCILSARNLQRHPSELIQVCWDIALFLFLLSWRICHT